MGAKHPKPTLGERKSLGCLGGFVLGALIILAACLGVVLAILMLPDIDL